MPVRADRFHLQLAALGHGLQRVVADIPEDLLDGVGIHLSHQRLGCKDALEADAARVGMVLQQDQRFFQQPMQVSRAKLIAAFPGIAQKIGDDAIQAL